MKKKLIVCILMLAFVAGCGEVPKLSDGKEAIVEFKDKTMISVDDVWSDMKSKYALSIILDKIDTQILEKEYKDKLKDADEYVKSYETNIKANYVDENGNYDEDTLLSALQQYGYSSLEDLLNQQKISYLTNLAVTDYAKKQISEKQIKDYYKKDYVGDIHCVHILVEPSSTDASDDTEAKEKAQSIIDSIKKDIKAGTEATKAFEKYKDDTSVTYQDLDYFNKGDMVSEFETAAFALKVGEYSKSPVKTQYGYHVILKLDEKEKEKYDDAKDEIAEKLATELIEDDANVQVNAMVELRKTYGVEFHDDDLKDQYNRYINNLINTNNQNKKNQN